MSKKTQSPKSARERMRAERAKRAEQERRRDRMMKIVIAVVVIVVIAGIGVAVQWQRASVDTTASYPQGVAFGYDDPEAESSKDNPNPEPGIGEGIAHGQQDAPVLVESFVDFACPHCKQFETAAASTIDKYVQQGKIRVITYPMTLSEFGRPTELAANAYACAVNEDQKLGQKYFEALYANYSQQWTTDQLIALGEQVGLGSGKFRNCVNNGAFSAWVESMDKTATQRNVQATPTVFVDGEQLPLQDTSADGLRVAIEQALKDSKDKRG